MDEPRRNDAFDQELRRVLTAGGGASSGAHVDAEVAAAWIERRLDAGAQRVVEAHLADCADCQAMLATLARISPEGAISGGEGLAWRRCLRAGWLVPATVAAAAALVIWVAVPRQRQASESAHSVAPPQSTSTTPEAAATPASPAPDRNAVSQPPAPAAPLTPSTDAPQTRLNLERRDALADASVPSAPAPQPPRASAVPPAPPAESDKASAKLEAEAPAVEARRERITPRQETAAGAAARAVDSSSRMAANRSGALTIVAADSGARWRRAGGAIEFAPRGGVPFTPATLPITPDLIDAGSSPGGTVCWLVGRSGVVLVTTDGLRFTRVTVPALVDLVAVTATDARSAIVTATGDRRFRTTDAGASWTVVQ